MPFHSLTCGCVDCVDFISMMDKYLALDPEVIKRTRLEYLVTFTKSPQLSFSDWLHSLQKQLKKKFILSYKAGVEHLDTNPHCHVLMESKERITKRKFSKFPCFIDLRRVKVDNGVEDYIGKESPVLHSFLEIKNYIGLTKNLHTVDKN